MSFMSFHIDGTEQTGRTKILTCPAADTTLHIDYRNLWRILVFRYTRHHLYGSRRTMACTVATLHTIRQWYAIFLYPHGMPYLNGDLSALVIGRIAPAGHTSEHFVHSGLQ